MKLPEDKKERTQMLTLIGIGTVIAIVLVFQCPVVGILPVMKSKKEKLAKIEEINDQIKAADKEIRKLNGDKAENLEALKKIMEISEKYVIKPVMGINYKLSANDIIEPIANQLNIKIEQSRQVGITAETAQNSFRCYTVRISTFCSYNDMVKFIREIEKKSPLLSVLNIAIAGQPGSSEKHMVSFDVQWPVWTDLEMPDKLAQQLKDLTKTP